jgi:hypothetical protein
MKKILNYLELVPKYIALYQFKSGYNDAAKAFNGGCSIERLQEMLQESAEVFTPTHYEFGMKAFIAETIENNCLDLASAA